MYIGIYKELIQRIFHSKKISFLIIKTIIKLEIGINKWTKIVFVASYALYLKESNLNTNIDNKHKNNKVDEQKNKLFIILFFDKKTYETPIIRK